MKKALSVMMATAMTAAALTGCGGGSGSETQAPAANGGAAETKAAAASGEKAEDVFWTVMACPSALHYIRSGYLSVREYQAYSHNTKSPYLRDRAQLQSLRQ